MYKQNDFYIDLIKPDQTKGLPLFDDAELPPKVIDDATEVKAEVYEKIKEQLQGTQFWDVYLAFREIGPATDYQIAKKLGIERSSVNARRNELVKRGLIEKADVIEVIRGNHKVKNQRWKIKQEIKN